MCATPTKPENKKWKQVVREEKELSSSEEYVPISLNEAKFSEDEDALELDEKEDASQEEEEDNNQ